VEGTQFLGAELIGRAAEVAGQAGDAGHVSLNGTGRVVAEAQIVYKALS
jgi:hypothetical protein